MTTDRILTPFAACQLADIVRAAQDGKPVARQLDDVVVYGTARCVGDDRGNHAQRGDDVRDCFLRVTSRGGFELFWPVSDLVTELAEGTFVLDHPYPEPTISEPPIEARTSALAPEDLASLRAVLDYIWAGESADYARQDDAGRVGHVFLHLRRLQGWLDSGH
jgi:hypothetical protein